MKFLSLIITMVFLILNVSLTSAEETVKVAAIFSKTGKAALGNVPSLNGIRFAVKELNQQGGLLGKQVELLEFDNKSSALGSKLAAEKAIQANVVITFGALWSSHSFAMAQVFQAAKIPMITPASTNPQVTLVGDFIFRACFIDSFQGKVLAKFVVQDLKMKTAGVLINANSKYSEGLAKSFIEYFKGHNGQILFEENYLEQTVDFSSLIAKIKTFQPEILFLPAHDKDAGYIIKQTRDSKILTPFIGGDAWSNDLYNIAGNKIEGNFFSHHWHQKSSENKSRKFVTKYKKHFQNLDDRDALSYDTVFLFADAVHRAASLAPAKIRDALAVTKNFKGVTGNISFDKNGDPIKSAVILKFDKGTSVYVKTVAP